LHNALSLIILNIFFKKGLVTVEEEDVPYASTVINFKNAQVNTSLDLALGYLKKKFINPE
jgi:hypothetical protein